MATWVWILIVIAAVVVVAVIVMADRQRRTTGLRERFGPEYDRAVQDRQGRRLAEADLRDREKQRAQLEIRPLPEDARARFAEEWREVQERFVDQPSEAVVAADKLVHSVMEKRGYPMGDFDAQADLVSVDHPEVVENYRAAHGIHQRAEQQQASTENLREALVRYRSLFEELLQAEDGQAAVTAGRGAGNLAGQRSADRSGLDPNADGQDASRSPDASREETEVRHDRL
jgi:FtsZ-interacting cell division protein ZipA